MAQTLEQLARQSKTLTSISSIVRTMKTLSAINAVPYEQAAASIEAYQYTLEKGFAAFAYKTQGRYFNTQSSAKAKRLLIVFGSDHGLCGNYNEQLAEQVARFYQAKQPAEITVFCVGGKMQQSLQDHKLSTEALLMPPASVDGLNRLASELVQRIEAFSRGMALTDLAVHLAFTQRAEHGTREPLISTLLPVPNQLFKPVQHWPSSSLPSFSLSESSLLASLVRNYLYVRLYRASAEAMATENAARLALMQQAEQSVAERLDEVKKEMAQVRQEEITTELMDIIIGHLEES